MSCPKQGSDMKDFCLKQGHGLNVLMATNLHPNFPWVSSFSPGTSGQDDTVNPLLSPQGGLLFQTYLRGWGGGGLLVSGGLFHFANTLVSLLHKELEYKVENLSKSWRSCSGGSKTSPNFQLVNKTSQISPHELLLSWLVNKFNHLLLKNDNGDWRRLKREGAWKGRAD